VRIGYTPRPLLDESRVVPRGGEARRQRLVDLFAWAGCEEIEAEERVGWRPGWVTCRLAGASESTIVVSAPFGRRGARDRRDAWMGAALLPSLYRSIRAVERHHTYVFLAYDEPPPDASDLQPASFPSHALSDSVFDHLVASVGVQRVRFKRAGVWRAGADPYLYRDFVSVSKSLEIPTSRIRSQGSAPQTSNTPTISIGIIDHWIGEYLDSFRLVAAYLGYLDQTIPIRGEMHASKSDAMSP
jgi:hypothetical protein